MTPGLETMVFYIGLGTLIIGNGLFKPNISTMVGDLYEEGDHRRDGAFTIFYMGINLGAALSGFVVAWPIPTLAIKKSSMVLKLPSTTGKQVSCVPVSVWYCR